MKISFVIPAYNEEKRIGICLSAMQKEIARHVCTTEIVVVNNASTDGTRTIASSFSGVTIVDESRKGLLWARRAGHLATTGELVAHIDADTLMPEGWLSTVLDEFGDEKLLGLSGPYIYYDAPPFTKAISSFFYTVGFTFNKLQEMFGHGSLFQGGNYVVRRKAFDQIGGYDTSIEFYGEDTDIGRRLRKIGKVKWTFRLSMPSSGRRFEGEGIIRTGINYFLNYIWTSFLGRPFTMHHQDFRPESQGQIKKIR
jgi:glycosyltransferase involved in cell wall biosynthesis